MPLLTLIGDKRLMTWMVLWYIFSATTLFLNKYIVSYQNGDAMFLGVIQLFSCTLISFCYLQYGSSLNVAISARFECWPKAKLRTNGFNLQFLLMNFFKFSSIGACRFMTVSMALFALWYIPVSFAEIIKSSAPIFTVIISIFILHEKTSLRIILSLTPIMVGLCLCSAYEIHFNLIGFFIALLANLSECMQNVLSKRLLTTDKFDPNQIQLYTSIFSVLIQIPYLYYFIYTKFTTFSDIFSDHQLLISYLACGISYYLQTITEYALLNMISPVSHSVANTVKRAFLIWLSVFIFNNPVTLMSWIGTFMVIFGVFVYNNANEQLANDVPYQKLKPNEAEHSV